MPAAPRHPPGDRLQRDPLAAIAVPLAPIVPEGRYRLLVGALPRGQAVARADGCLGYGEMGERQRSQLNLNALLAAVEAAPPVAAVDVLGVGSSVPRDENRRINEFSPSLEIKSDR